MVTTFNQAPVVQKLDSAILRINHCFMHWIEIYPVDKHLGSVNYLLNN